MIDGFLFLDFDGVLNCQRTWGRRPDPLDRDLVERVEAFCQREHLGVVVSSTWRLGTPLPTLRGILRAHGLLATPVLSKTPEDPRGGLRGDEIQRWLTNQQYPRRGAGRRTYYRRSLPFVILDDDADMGHLSGYLAQTDYHVGVTDRDLERASRILREGPQPLPPPRPGGRCR